MGWEVGAVLTQQKQKSVTSNFYTASGLLYLQGTLFTFCNHHPMKQIKFTLIFLVSILVFIPEGIAQKPTKEEIANPPKWRYKMPVKQFRQLHSEDPRAMRLIALFEKKRKNAGTLIVGPLAVGFLMNYTGDPTAMTISDSYNPRTGIRTTVQFSPIGAGLSISFWTGIGKVSRWSRKRLFQYIHGAPMVPAIERRFVELEMKE